MTVVRRALASINLAATERNAASLCARLSGDATLCAVVKARASGHGAAASARAALAGGARSLAVATAGEALELREAGLEAPILVLGAISDAELPEALAARAEVTAWDPRFVEALAVAVRAGGADAGSRRRAVHVKYDTGIGRLGTRDLEAALAVAERVHAEPGLALRGAMTHLATADSDPEFMRAQLETFAPFAQRMRAVAPVVVHAANSAATIAEPASHFDMVRCGIALHGGDPFNADPDAVGLEPALELRSYAAAVKLARAGESVGYGRRFVAGEDTWIATLPIGYADGVARADTNNGDVLIAGRRRPIVGTVSMDNTTVDLGPAASAPIEVGEPAIVIGRSGAQRITAEEVAHRRATINHEVLCAISDRVVRVYHADGAPQAADGTRSSAEAADDRARPAAAPASR